MQRDQWIISEREENIRTDNKTRHKLSTTDNDAQQQEG